MNVIDTAHGRHLLSGSVEILPPETIGSGHVAILWSTPAPGIQVGIPLTTEDAVLVRKALKRSVQRARGGR